MKVTTLGIIASTLVGDAATSALLAVVYKLIVTESLWGSILSAWRPLPDPLLFMLLMFLVHEGLYIGVARIRCITDPAMCNACVRTQASTLCF